MNTRKKHPTFAEPNLLIQEAYHVYRTVFDVAGTAMVVIAADTTIMLANFEMERLGSCSLEEVEGKVKIAQFIHPKDLERIHGYHKQRRSGENPPESYTLTLVDFKGQEKEILVKTRLIPGTESSVAALIDLSETTLCEKNLRESEEKLRLLFEHAQEGIYQSTPEGTILLANPAFVNMLGYSSFDEVKKLNISQDIYYNTPERETIIQRLIKERSITNLELNWKKKDGTPITVRNSGRTITNENQEIICFENTVVNITDLKETQRELEVSRQYFKNIVNCLPDPTFAIDIESKVVAWNKAMEQLTSIPASEMLGKGNYEYSIPFFHETRPILVDYALDTSLPIGDQYAYFRRDDDTIIAESYSPYLRDGKGAHLWGSASIIRDTDNNAIGAINTIKDFTDYKETEAQLKYLSMHDVLTGLYNRMYFEEELVRISNARFMPVSVILCDVDGLKFINDSMGHHRGDEVLKAAANVISSAFRSSDAVTRVGGDEFAVILPECDHESAEKAANRIQIALNEYNVNNSTFPLSLSIGYATGTMPPQNIVIEADNHLNRKKLYRSTSAKSHFTTTLMAMLAERDFITEGHAERLKNMAEIMADALKLSSRDKSDLILLATFHDIGKVGISDNILFKPGRLTQKEREEMKRHSEIGYRIAQSSPDLNHIAHYILHHHEWWNGHGYPFGLKEDKIPLPCRILSILDAYDAITSDRPYRKALKPDVAIHQIQEDTTIIFDPTLVKIFTELLTVNKDFFSA